MNFNAIFIIQIQLVRETRLSCSAMSSVLSHWLTAEPFVLSLYKCDTTRMVGRPVNTTAQYTSRSYLLKKIHSGWISLIPLIYLHSLHLNSVQLINTPHIPISLIPHIYPHLPKQHAAHQSPTHPYLINPIIYLHSLHLNSVQLINPPHIPISLIPQPLT